MSNIYYLNIHAYPDSDSVKFDIYLKNSDLKILIKFKELPITLLNNSFSLSQAIDYCNNLLTFN